MYLRFPDREVGQFPMAYVVRKSGSDLSESAVMDFVAKQVKLKFIKQRIIDVLTSLDLSISLLIVNC